MATAYSPELCKKLEREIQKAKLHRPLNIKQYDEGTRLTYDITGIDGGNRGKITLLIEKFIGGGFAGQVYKAKILDCKFESKPIESLTKGKIVALKIFIPPTTFSKLFRNILYSIGFQAPFQLQTNLFAVKAGALWQKFIRRGAKIYFKDENAVADVYAILIDKNLGSCGELREWVEGRTWKLEVDEYMDLLSLWAKKKEVDLKNLGSPEYRAKHDFMVKFVELLHDMGAFEIARQYEWSTYKSQPNCLKRYGTDDSPSRGLVAVDFRAGLVLLPFLPMSPGDFKLIFSGLLRGSLVQFDRGDIYKLKSFIEKHKSKFADMKQLLTELESTEKEYRNSIPDITHNHIKLLYSSQLWNSILNNAVNSWNVQNLIDEQMKEKMHSKKALIFLFFLLGLIPLFGNVMRKFWGRQEWRIHYLKILSSFSYCKKAVRAKMIECLISWHRAGRIDEQHTKQVLKQLWRFFYHLPLSLLPTGIHRILTDWKFAIEKFNNLAIRPIKLYFNADLRALWLKELVEEGKRNHLLTEEDENTILKQIDEPFIQKYLKSLAVHLCTLPITQLVSVTIAIIFILTHPEMPKAKAYSIAAGIIALFQVVPISPGSFVRGSYVLYLVIAERNFKDYNIALLLGFFKYIGYLAFPIQMTYKYPVLARFMASKWAIDAVHIVPVFGERGALLEHSVFCMFYNWSVVHFFIH